jgi:hypothetical protein
MLKLPDIGFDWRYHYVNDAAAGMDASRWNVCSATHDGRFPGLKDGDTSGPTAA